MTESMTIEAWFALAVVASVLMVLVFTRLSADVVFVGALSILLISGILDASSALSGFSSSGMITVAVLYVVVAGLQQTGGLAWITHHVLGFPKGLFRAQSRLIIPVLSLSAFLNNTPVVALFIPVVSDWCRRLKISPSRMLIPLSYASIFGGICTLVGTSTNLIVDGMMQDRLGWEGMGMFEITKLGLPCAVAGVLYLLLFSRHLLPDRKKGCEPFDNPREYTMEMEVPQGSPIAGQSIERSGLRHLPGAFLAELIRNGQVISAVSPDERLCEGDRLIFVGNVDSMKSLSQQQGLSAAPDQLFKLESPRHERCLVEAVVSNTCPIVGKTIREGRFRNLYNAVVLAVSRNGERLDGKIGDIRIRAGDLLLIESHAGFVPRQRDSGDFYLVSLLDDSTPRRFEKAPLAFAILAGMVLSVAVGWLPMLHAALIAAGAMLLFKCCSASQARKNIEWNVLIVIAAALGLGQALDQTGAAEAIAEGLIGLVNASPLATLAMVYIATVVFTEIITNNASVALIFPIAVSAASRLGVNAMPFIGCIMIAGSASFMTPIGYQTNLMVYGPGGYRYKDYFRMGAPLSLIFGIIAVGLAPLIWPF